MTEVTPYPLKTLDFCYFTQILFYEQRPLVRKFDIFYLNSERGAIGESIHEIVHFMWFYVWNQLFGDDYDEYERPLLKVTERYDKFTFR